MKRLQAVLVAALFFVFGLAIDAQSIEDKMVELKTGAAPGWLIVEPAKIEYAVLQWPAPSPTFKPTPLKGVLKGGFSSAVPLKDGGFALASSNGGYIVSKDGDVMVIGEGKPCGGVAASSAGEIAFGFSLRSLFILTDVRDRSRRVFREVVEVHMVVLKPRTIVVGQQWSDDVLSKLAFRDGMLVVATYRMGAIFIKDDKAFKCDGKVSGIFPSADKAINDKFIALVDLFTVTISSRIGEESRHIMPVSEGKFLDRCVNAVVFRPTGELLVVTSKEVSEWNPKTGKKIRTILKAQ